jgi:hypothetical protein
MAKPKRSLGNFRDNPEEIGEVAYELLGDADPRSKYHVRAAAELAHLAMSSALEKAADRNFTSYREERAAVSKLPDKKLRREYEQLRRALHTECFHAGVCESVQYKTGLAIGWAKSVARLKIRVPRK